MASLSLIIEIKGVGYFYLLFFLRGQTQNEGLGAFRFSEKCLKRRAEMLLSRCPNIAEVEWEL